MGLIVRRVYWKLGQSFVLNMILVTFAIVLSLLTAKGIAVNIPLALLPLALVYILPLSLAYALPVIMISVILYIYAGMAHERENVILQVSGISMRPISVPAMWMGILASLLSIGLLEVHQIWGQHGIERLISANAEKILYGKLKQEKSIQFQSYEIQVRDVSDGNTLIEPTLSMVQGSGELLLSAGKATIQTGSARQLWTESEGKNNLIDTCFIPQNPDETLVRITFSDIHTNYNNMEASLFENQILFLPLHDFMSGGHSERPADIPLIRLLPFIDECEERVESIENQMAFFATQQMLLGNWGGWTDDFWRTHYEDIQHEQEMILRARIEPYRRMTQGLAAFLFTWLAVPFSLWLGEKISIVWLFVRFASFFVAPFCLMFLFFLNGSKGGRFSPAWFILSLVLGFLAGFFLWYKAYTPSHSYRK